MKLDAFVAGAVGFAQAVASGNAVQVNPVEPIIPGAGLPVWPVYALRQAVQAVPDARAVEAEARRAIETLLPVVRASGALLQAGGVIAGALAPVAGVVGPVVAPALAGIPYVGAAVGAAATAAGPIVAAGGAVAAAAGGLASGAPDPETLRKLGDTVIAQINDLQQQSAADVVIDQPSTGKGPQP